jgi:hypothetical protein
MDVEKRASVEDQLKDKAFEVLEVGMLDGKVYFLQIEREKAYCRETLYRELLKANVAMPTDRYAALYELEDVIRQEPRERWVYAPSAGWFDDEAAFLLGDDLIGDVADVRVFPPDGLFASTSIDLLRRGKLASWRRSIASPALAFPPWVVALSAAFTAPLLAPCGWPTFRLHLFGGTEPRRMAAIAVAGSAAGLGQAFITQLSRLAAGRLPVVARLLTDLAVPVVEPDASLYGPLRARPCAIADNLLSDANGGDSGLVTDGESTWRPEPERCAVRSARPRLRLWVR